MTRKFAAFLAGEVQHNASPLASEHSCQLTPLKRRRVRQLSPTSPLNTAVAEPVAAEGERLRALVQAALGDLQAEGQLPQGSYPPVRLLRPSTALRKRVNALTPDVAWTSPAALAIAAAARRVCSGVEEPRRWPVLATEEVAAQLAAAVAGRMHDGCVHAAWGGWRVEAAGAHLNFHAPSAPHATGLRKSGYAAGVLDGAVNTGAEIASALPSRATDVCRLGHAAGMLNRPESPRSPLGSTAAQCVAAASANCCIASPVCVASRAELRETHAAAAVAHLSLRAANGGESALLASGTLPAWAGKRAEPAWAAPRTGCADAEAASCAGAAERPQVPSNGLGGERRPGASCNGHARAAGPVAGCTGHAEAGGASASWNGHADAGGLNAGRIRHRDSCGAAASCIGHAGAGGSGASCNGCAKTGVPAARGFAQAAPEPAADWVAAPVRAQPRRFEVVTVSSSPEVRLLLKPWHATLSSRSPGNPRSVRVCCGGMCWAGVVRRGCACAGHGGGIPAVCKVSDPAPPPGARAGAPLHRAVELQLGSSILHGLPPFLVSLLRESVRQCFPFFIKVRKKPFHHRDRPLCLGGRGPGNRAGLPTLSGGLAAGVRACRGLRHWRVLPLRLWILPPAVLAGRCARRIRVALMSPVLSVSCTVPQRDCHALGLDMCPSIHACS